MKNPSKFMSRVFELVLRTLHDAQVNSQNPRYELRSVRMVFMIRLWGCPIPVIYGETTHGIRLMSRYIVRIDYCFRLIEWTDRIALLFQICCRQAHQLLNTGSKYSKFTNEVFCHLIVEYENRIT